MKVENILYKSIAQDLRKLIESHVYRPGQKLPSVRKLSKQWSVSLATIQSAYGELESQGLIRSKPQSGFLVEAIPSQLLPEPLISLPTPTFEDPGEGHLATSIVDTLNFGPNLIPYGTPLLFIF